MSYNITEHITALEAMKKYPAELFYKGNLELLGRPKVSIVGTRRPSLYTQQYTYALAKALSDRGVCVVSGAAMGVDAVAHDTGITGEVGFGQFDEIGQIGQCAGIDAGRRGCQMVISRRSIYKLWIIRYVPCSIGEGRGTTIAQGGIRIIWIGRCLVAPHDTIIERVLVTPSTLFGGRIFGERTVIERTVATPATVFGRIARDDAIADHHVAAIHIDAAAGSVVIVIT